MMNPLMNKSLVSDQVDSTSAAYASFFAPTIEFSDSTHNMADEGSTSAKNLGGYIPSLFLALQLDMNRSLIPANDASDYSQLSFETSADVIVSDPARPQTTNGAGSRGARRAHGARQGAESRTAFCKAHGGGSRCQHLGCTKSAEGKTDFCIAHGGGRRCGAVEGCTKSARGRTDSCVRHGGGKRCAVEGCEKSAQGSTEFCKAHGGGKRCNWGGEGKCEKFARGRSGLCAAHTSLMNGRQGRKGGGGKGLIGAGLFHRLVGSAPSSTTTSVVTSDITGLEQRPAKRQQHIPPQVLVPLSMKSASSMYSGVTAGGSGGGGSGGFEGYWVPEGRVHSGGLMSLLGGNLNNAL